MKGSKLTECKRVAFDERVFHFGKHSTLIAADFSNMQPTDESIYLSFEPKITGKPEGNANTYFSPST
ncbi:hypothetical protein ANTRET_LOCUS9805 [Anthophora retusa]